VIARATLMRRGRRSRNAWEIASKGLLAAGVAALIYLIASIVMSAWEGQLAAVGQASPWWAIGLAGLVYIGSHMLRILRLALLVGAWRVGLRTLGSFHLMTAAVSLVAPLKLGEVYRIVGLGNIVGGPVRAVVIVWWERTFDAAAILFLIVIVLMFGSSSTTPHTYGVALLALAFILTTAVVVAIAPENLRRLSVFIIRRYDSAHTVPLLHVIDLVRRSIEEAPRTVRHKVTTLAALTGLIWTAEAACFAIVYPTLRGTLDMALTALLAFLSAVTKGETLLSALDVNRAALDGYALSYLSATQIPLAFIGLLAALHYLPRGLRQ
jgi:Lysylphosphatidylglycerol synthase TM region